MGTEQSSQAEIAGQANTNIVVEQGLAKIDVFHSIILLLLLGLLSMQMGYIIYRQHTRSLKRKYLERARTTNVVWEF